MMYKAKKKDAVLYLVIAFSYYDRYLKTIPAAH